MEYEEKVREIEHIYWEVCDCCNQLEKLIKESKRLVEKYDFECKLDMLNARKSTLELCLLILKR